jgi:hypothetical protein
MMSIEFLFIRTNFSVVLEINKLGRPGTTEENTGNSVVGSCSERQEASP